MAKFDDGDSAFFVLDGVTRVIKILSPQYNIFSHKAQFYLTIHTGSFPFQQAKQILVT